MPADVIVMVIVSGGPLGPGEGAGAGGGAGDTGGAGEGPADGDAPSPPHEATNSPATITPTESAFRLR